MESNLVRYMAFTAIVTGVALALAFAVIVLS